MFYLEINAHQRDDRFQECMQSLYNGLNPQSKDIEVVRVLGSYEKQAGN